MTLDSVHDRLVEEARWNEQERAIRAGEARARRKDRRILIALVVWAATVAVLVWWGSR